MDEPSSTVKNISGSESTTSAGVPSPYLWVGIGLVMLGVAWLTWNMDLLYWSWIERYGFVIAGVIILVKSVVQRTYHLAAALTLLGVGIFHLYLDYAGVGSMRSLWPVYFLIIGLAFMVNFLFNSKRWMSLTASMVLLMTGGILLSRSYFRADVPAIELIRTYWPLTLVASGIILLATALVRRKRMEEREGTHW